MLIHMAMDATIKRRAAMHSFSKNYRDPALSVVEEVRVPDFRSRLRVAGVRGVHFLLHALAQASWQVPEFRLREKGGEMVVIDALHCSYVVQNPHTDINHCSVPYDPDLMAFAAAAQLQEAHARQAPAIINSAPDPDHIAAINLSIIPWLRLDSITHGSCSPIPMFTVGKFSTDRAAQLAFNLAIQVHHGLVDAYHIHQFIEQFRHNIKTSLASLPHE